MNQQNWYHRMIQDLKKKRFKKSKIFQLFNDLKKKDENFTKDMLRSYLNTHEEVGDLKNMFTRSDVLEAIISKIKMDVLSKNIADILDKDESLLSLMTKENLINAFKNYLDKNSEKKQKIVEQFFGFRDGNDVEKSSAMKMEIPSSFDYKVSMEGTSNSGSRNRKRSKSRSESSILMGKQLSEFERKLKEEQKKIEEKKKKKEKEEESKNKSKTKTDRDSLKKEESKNKSKSKTKTDRNSLQKKGGGVGSMLNTRQIHTLSTEPNNSITKSEYKTFFQKNGGYSKDVSSGSKFMKDFQNVHNKEKGKVVSTTNHTVRNGPRRLSDLNKRFNG